MAQVGEKKMEPQDDVPTVEDARKEYCVTKQVLAKMNGVYGYVKSLTPDQVQSLATDLETKVAPVTKQVNDLADTMDKMVVDKVVDFGVKGVDKVVDFGVKGVEAAQTAVVETKKDVEKRVSRAVSQSLEVPVVKDLLLPASAAVASGAVEAADIVVNYTLPTEVEDESLTASESEKIGEVELFQNACRVSKKLRKRASKALRKDLQARKEYVMHTSLIAYASRMATAAQETVRVPAAVQQCWLDSQGQPVTRRIQSLMEDALKTYKLQLKATQEKYVQPYWVAITDYGEYFMEKVHVYEGTNDDEIGSEEDASDAKMKNFIDGVTTKFIEPAVARIVAVFYVLNDEVRRFHVQRIEPAYLKLRETIATSFQAEHRARMFKHMRDSAELVAQNAWDHAQRLGVGMSLKVEQFYKIATDKFLELDENKDGKVSLAEFRKGVRSAILATGSEYHAYLEPLVERAYTAATRSYIGRALLNVRTQYKDLQEKAYNAFMELDVNADGEVTLADLQQIVSTRMGDAWDAATHLPVLRRMHLAAQIHAAGRTLDDAECEPSKKDE